MSAKAVCSTVWRGEKSASWKTRAGVTRDRVETRVAIPAENPVAPDLPLRAIDTGGWGIVDRADLGAEVERQIMAGCADADLVVFLIDGQQGVVPLDEQFARVLRETGVGSEGGKPVLLVVNKVDGEGSEGPHSRRLATGAWASRWRCRPPHGITGSRLWTPCARACPGKAPKRKWPAENDMGVKIALVGKRNAGKSTLTNALAGAERVIVSEQAGTTRDSVDVRCELEVGGKPQIVTLIDTAGVRKRKALQGRDIEYYSQHRSLRSVRRADVCLLLIDATVPVSQVDHQLVGEITKHHRPTVILVNKWDLVDTSEHDQETFVSYLDDAVKGLPFAPIVFTSAIDGEGLQEVLAMAINLHQQSLHRCPTGELNNALQAIMQDNPPRTRSGKLAKVFYATQTDINPPTLVFFVNDPELFDHNYQRFLENALRDVLPYSEVPFRMFFNGKGQMSAAERKAMRAARD